MMVAVPLRALLDFVINQDLTFTSATTKLLHMFNHPITMVTGSNPATGDLPTSVESKQERINANYETIEVLRNRLEEIQKRERTGMTRAAYIRMILDATRKVDRQNVELGKAVLETRQIQRAIRSLGGQLDRTFKQVEETILKGAAGDIWDQECYRLLRIMHGSCDKLIQAVQETGDLTREIRQLEDQVGQLRIRRTIEGMHGVNNDGSPDDDDVDDIDLGHDAS